LHKPVMVREVLEHLAGNCSGVLLDCTLGRGGHAKALLDQCDRQCTLIGLDQDDEAIRYCEESLSDYKNHVLLKKSNFSSLARVLQDCNVEYVNGCIIDLGVSSPQFDQAERGFSFMHDGPLDMRMDVETSLTAADIVNTYSEDDLNYILRTYGEEWHSRRIVRAILKYREQNVLSRTTELAALIKDAYPKRHYFKRHPATKAFQALRIAVNDEINALQNGLQVVLEHMAPEAVLCVITFHSIEDRVVKHTMREWKNKGLATLVTKKPIIPSDEEIHENNRARSAKLRVAKRSLHT